ncbi:hypothetical protein ANCDUO_08260 [Ancylostoma duodenale]|uniref:Uncharacterized protein n=1 Tax=Ancylostoma duodenale TaxID=51022 RepID=A0A0C2GQU8_9BILA|nr:hypothetical protein ANCDUO_08260 [Ancylostoma duodenale]
MMRLNSDMLYEEYVNHRLNHGECSRIGVIGGNPLHDEDVIQKRNESRVFFLGAERLDVVTHAPAMVSS